MRIAFFGTPAFAVPTLDALLASTHTVACVVTQPDRPRGRGQKVTPAPVKARAMEAGVPVLQPDKLTADPWAATLAAFDVDLGVVAAYGKILPEWLLAWPRLGLINVHASLLPRYRGASPIHRAVMNGDVETGVTIMRVVKALDAGAMLKSKPVSIGPDERTDEVERRLADVGADLLVQTVNEMALGPVPETPQDDLLATYAPRLQKEEGLMDWSRPARDLHNQVRGLHPWPHAYTFGPRGRLIVHRSAVVDTLVEMATMRHVEETHDAHTDAAGNLAPEPGTIVTAAGDTLHVATGDGLLALIEIQAEGGRALPVRQFLAGHPLAPGDQLGTP